MIAQSSQNIRPPERKPTAFGLALKEALERQTQPKPEENKHGPRY